MCIKGDGEVLVEKEYDLVVYKVMEKSIWDKGTLTTPFVTMREKSMLSRKASGWKDGFGYGCFPRKKYAMQYLRGMNRLLNIRKGRKFCVKRYRIPAGAKHEYGKTHSSFLCANIEAMRAIRLTEY
jgi:hypothetical protein